MALACSLERLLAVVEVSAVISVRLRAKGERVSAHNGVHVFELSRGHESDMS